MNVGTSRRLELTLSALSSSTAFGREGVDLDKRRSDLAKELLSKDIPKSRILSFGYDSGVVHSDIAEVTQGSLADDARYLCSLLDGVRKKTNTVR